jgi:hypothetical protein
VSAGPRCWIGLDGGERDRGQVEHDVLEIVGELAEQASFICTHVVRDPEAHYAGSLKLETHPAPRRLAALAAAAARAGYSAVAIGEGGEATRLGPDARWDGAAQVARLKAAGEEGRAIRFVGQAACGGVRSVREIVASSAVDRVEGLGSAVTPASLVDTCDFLRPLLRAGELVLVVTPLADGRFRPFEIASPHPCCDADH